MAWMHNGGIANFDHVRQQLLLCLDPDRRDSIVGTTDTEACFALFRQFLSKIQKSKDTLANVYEMAAALEQTVQWLAARASQSFGRNRVGSSMNFAVSNGEAMVCSRFRDKAREDAPTLYLGLGSAQELHMSLPHADQVVVAVASEPLEGPEPGDGTKHHWRSNSE